MSPISFKSSMIMVEFITIGDTKPKSLLVRIWAFFILPLLFVLVLELTNQLTKNAKTMIKLPFEYYCTELKVHPTNWESPKVDI